MPKIHTHIAIGIVSALILSGLISLTMGFDFLTYTTLVWVILAIIGSILPDILEPEGKKKYYKKQLFHNTKVLKISIILILVLFPFPFIRSFYLEIPFFLLLGYVLHILTDMRIT